MTRKRQKKLNLVEIARLAGTSKSTVSRVLRNQPRVAPETRKRVQEVMREHNYKPSLFARGLSGARTGLVGVLGRWMESGFYAEVIRGIDLEAKKHGGHILSSFENETEKFIELWQTMATGGQVDGVILIAPPLDIFKQELTDDHKPQVLCSADLLEGAGGWENADVVRLKNRESMLKLVQHLAEQGCKSLVHVAGAPDNLDAHERSRAFTEATSRHSGVSGSILPGAWTQEMGKSRAMEYLQSHGRLPDAFVAFNDAVALGVLEALNEKGLMTPQDVLITGWDDDRIAAYAGLTSVHIPMLQLGEESARMLFGRLEQEDAVRPAETVEIEMPLVIRRSSSR